MSNVPVPEASLIEIVGGLILATWGWLLRLERRPKGMTRKEHDEICNVHQAELRADMTEIKTMLERQNDRREALITEVNTIKVTVAVLESRGARAESNA